MMRKLSTEIVAPARKRLHYTVTPVKHPDEIKAWQMKADKRSESIAMTRRERAIAKLMEAPKPSMVAIPKPLTY
jgi:hypothetical protein